MSEAPQVDTDLNDSEATTVPPASAQTASKIVVHHLNNSRSQRILWLLEELNIPYEIKKYQRTAEMVAPKDLKAVHPLGKSPVITDGDVVIAESGAIVEYLIEKYGSNFKVSSSEGKIWTDNLYYTHYPEGSLMPLLVMKIIFSLIPQRTPFLLRFFARLICQGVSTALLDPAIAENVKLIESHLASLPMPASGQSQKWFTGSTHPTSADFMMIFALEGLIAGRAILESATEIKKYVDAVHARPAWKTALEKGGPYELTMP